MIAREYYMKEYPDTDIEVSSDVSSTLGVVEL